MLRVQQQVAIELATSEEGRRGQEAAETQVREGLDVTADAIRTGYERLFQEIERTVASVRFEREGQDPDFVFGEGETTQPFEEGGQARQPTPIRIDEQPDLGLGGGATRIGTEATIEGVEAAIQRRRDEEAQFEFIEPEEESGLIRQFLPDFTGTDQELRELPEFVGLRVAALEYFNEVRERAAEEIEEAARESVERPLAPITDLPSENPLDDPLSFLGRSAIADRAERDLDFEPDLEGLERPERQAPSRDILGEIGGGFSQSFGNQLGIDGLSGLSDLFSVQGLSGLAGGFAGNLALNALNDILFSLEDGVVGWLRRIFDQGEGALSGELIKD